jgi:chemosensory pili system protein ChpA (sensor histidine kinase/response regulator)
MSSFEGVTALIIEDDPTSADVLENLLSHVGVGFTTVCTNIPEHIQSVERPDVIFLDLEMPGMNGYEVLELLRNTEQFQNIPIVAYTTHTSHLTQAHNAGFSSFLGKPLNRHDFAENLSRILRGESVWEIQ